MSNTPTTHQIMEALNSTVEYLTYGELTELTGSSLDTIKTAVAHLVEQGLIDVFPDMTLFPRAQLWGENECRTCERDNCTLPGHQGAIDLPPSPRTIGEITSIDDLKPPPTAPPHPPRSAVMFFHIPGKLLGAVQGWSPQMQARVGRLIVEVVQ